MIPTSGSESWRGVRNIINSIGGFGKRVGGGGVLSMLAQPELGFVVNKKLNKK